MDTTNIDYAIVIAFVLVTLVMGLRAGWNVKDMRDYAVANKTFGTGALVSTLLATNLAGASVVNAAAELFSVGIIITVITLAVSYSFLVTALVAPKAANYESCFTMGDLMREFYGVSSGIIAGVLGLLSALLIAGMELIVLGIICESLLGIPAQWAIVVGGILLATYVVYGGIRSVTITDVFQFIVLAVFIPVIAYIAVSHVGGITVLFSQVPADNLAVFDHPRFSFYLTLFLIWCTPAGMIDPALIQRMLMAKHGYQLRHKYLMAAAFDPSFQLAIMLIGLSGLVLYPYVEAQQVLPHMIHHLLPVGIKGLAMAGVLAVCTSTIDSYMHAAGLTLVHDVIGPIYKKQGVQIDELKWVRIGTVLVSLGAIAIGLYATDILGLAFSALEFTSPLLMFPLFSGIMGLKAEKVAFYVALVATLVAFVGAKLFLPAAYAHFSILICMVINGIFFFGTHVARQRSFVMNTKTENGPE